MRSSSTIYVVAIALVTSWMPGIAPAETINGAGSTFIAPIVIKWIESYSKIEQGVQITYQPVGSFAGLDRLLSHKVDFAASDAPLRPTQLDDAACRVMYFPATLGAVVMIYNLPEIPVTTRLRFTGPLLADVYAGKIRKWNDPAIMAVNPGAALPAQDIIVIYRRDGSGTTYAFTDYLAKVSPQWTKNYGAGMLVRWPRGMGADGNEGIAKAVGDLKGAIGYVELNYAVNNTLPFALVQNRTGNWEDATPETITAAADSTIAEMPSDLRQSITDAPAPLAYPIASYSYLVSFQRQNDLAKAGAFGKFVNWVLHDGQSYAHDLHYGTVPAKLTALAADQIKHIQIASGITGGESCKATLGLAPHQNTVPIIRHEDEEGSLSSD